MITPKQANGLKPSEVEWLREAEALVDRKLREGFAGGDTRFLLKPGPFVRDIDILRRHSADAGWSCNTYITQGFPELVLVLFSREPLTPPQFPVTGTETETAKTTETAWDRILTEED